MNETITLPRLISQLAAAAGCSPAIARKYIHDLFADVEEALADGESYTVEGIGEFAPGIDASSPVLFRPDPMLAAALNEPFEAFSAVELPAEYHPEATTPIAPSEEDIPAIDTVIVATQEEDIDNRVEYPENDSVAPIEPDNVEIDNADDDAADEAENSQLTESEAESDGNSDEGTIQLIITPEEVEIEDDSEARQISAHSPTPNSPWLLFICGALMGLIIGLIAGYFAGNAVGRYHIPEDEEDYDADSIETVIAPAPAPKAVEVSTTPQPADTATAVQESRRQDTSQDVTEQTKVTKEPVYDTITSTKFLTTMARNHYGVKAYWVFIYEANPGLGNPNHIRPGTRILIPDMSTFREETPEATKAKAQRHLNALAEKYKL